MTVQELINALAEYSPDAKLPIAVTAEIDYDNGNWSVVIEELPETPEAPEAPEA